MRLLTIVGARPQFIKAAAVGYAIEAANANGAGIQSLLVHTGQHYDFEMSRVFFEELGLQAPTHQLGVGSSSHGAQTGRMLEAIENVIAEEKPDIALVYGDTNSTLAGALAAAKLHVPVAHVEAGLRSYNRRMPEEVNRVLTDHVSSWLFCPTETARQNLDKEGIQRGVTVCGDVMYELIRLFASEPVLPSDWVASGLSAGRYVLATIHRAENTDTDSRLHGIFGALAELASEIPVIVPLHPRTQKRIASMGIKVPDQLRIVPPLGYRAMVGAEVASELVVTDSGGVQKEAYWLGVPCVTVRGETEWPETLLEDRNILTGADRTEILLAARRQLMRGKLPQPEVELAKAGSEIVRLLT